MLHPASFISLFCVLLSSFSANSMQKDQSKEVPAKPRTIEDIVIAEKLILRLAQPEDIPALQQLIALSVRGLMPDYTSAQREAALGSVFGVDSQLISDGSYYVVEYEHTIVGCGGWSKRKKLFGSDHAAQQDAGLLDPKQEAARIRAFFVHPHYARRGIGTKLLRHCEQSAFIEGFTQLELAATLPGIPLYSTCGFTPGEEFYVEVTNGERLKIVRMTKTMVPSALSPLKMSK